MTDRLYLIQNNGNSKNVGKDFKSYDFDTVEQCARLFLGDEARQYVLRVPKMDLTDEAINRGVYEWDCHKVVLFAPPTPAAHQAVLRLCHLGRVKALPGYCFVVTRLGVGDDLVAVFDNVQECIDYLASVEQPEADDLFVRIVPFNKLVG